MAERKLLLSRCVIMWATLASAVGDTKLALTAMLTERRPGASVDEREKERARTAREKTPKG
jgi:hypothetical protein